MKRVFFENAVHLSDMIYTYIYIHQDLPTGLMGAPLTMGVIAAPLIFLVVAKLFFGHFCLYSFQSHLKARNMCDLFSGFLQGAFSCKWHVLKNMKKEHQK